jgi:phosphate starvation-inducible protein PhoH
MSLRSHDPAQDAEAERYVDAIDAHTIVFGIGPRRLVEEGCASPTE